MVARNYLGVLISVRYLKFVSLYLKPSALRVCRGFFILKTLVNENNF